MKKLLRAIFFTTVLVLGFSTIANASEQNQCEEMKCLAIRVLSTIGNPILETGGVSAFNEVFANGETQVQFVFHFDDGTEREYSFSFYSVYALSEYDVTFAALYFPVGSTQWVRETVTWTQGRPLPTGLAVNATGAGGVLWQGTLARVGYRMLISSPPVYSLTFEGIITRIS